MQMSLFVDYDALEKQKIKEAAEDAKEKQLQKATLLLKEKFGKNAVLKGMNLEEGATTILRNQQIGGHAAGGTKPAENRKQLHQLQGGEEKWQKE